MKKLAIIGAVLVVVGAIVFAIGFKSAGNLYEKSVGTGSVVEETIDVNEEFDNIVVSSSSLDVELIYKNEPGAKIETKHYDYQEVKTEVKDNKLVVELKDKGTFLDHVGIFTEKTYITIYLDKETYSNLKFVGSSGDLYVNEGFTFEDIAADASSGDVSLNSKVNGDIDVNTSSGGIGIRNSEAKNLSASSSSGDILVSETTISGLANINSSSGDVFFTDADAKDIEIRTSSGDVSMLLRTDKKYDLSTSSGDITKPESEGTNICKVSTSSGDIKIEVAE